MRRWVGVAAAAFAVAATVVAACSSPYESAPSGEDAGGTAESGADARTDAPGSTTIDAGDDAGSQGSDGGDATSCNREALPSGALVPLDKKWQLLGTATTTSGGTVALTADATNQAGAMWWKPLAWFDTMTVSIEFRLTHAGYPGDGMVFALVPGDADSIPDLNGAGSSFGLQGTGAFGVVLDTYPNPGDPSTPFLALLDPAVDAGIEGNVPLTAGDGGVLDQKVHTLVIAIDAPKVTITLDGLNRLVSHTIPGFTAFGGHFGLTATSGDFHEQCEILSIAVDVPNGAGCLP